MNEKWLPTVIFLYAKFSPPYTPINNNYNASFLNKSSHYLGNYSHELYVLFSNNINCSKYATFQQRVHMQNDLWVVKYYIQYTERKNAYTSYTLYNWWNMVRISIMLRIQRESFLYLVKVTALGCEQSPDMN